MHYLPPVTSAPRPIPFRWILPLGQLVLSLSLLSLVHAIPGYSFWPIRRAVATGVTMLNMPGTFVQLPEAMLRSSRTFWTPPGIDLQSWLAVTSCILALPFWWMAGRALEALRAVKHKLCTPRINWVETVVNFVVMSGGAVIFATGVMFGFFVDHDPLSLHLGAAGGLWALLGSLSVIARFRQWRVRKRMLAHAA